MRLTTDGGARVLWMDAVNTVGDATPGRINSQAITTDALYRQNASKAQGALGGLRLPTFVPAREGLPPLPVLTTP